VRFFDVRNVFARVLARFVVLPIVGDFKRRIGLASLDPQFDQLEDDGDGDRDPV
jgi:hypothetical protein